MRIFLFIIFLIFSIETFAQDSIVVQIAHGSVPRKQYKGEIKTIGGKKGGHVVIQIDNFVYGFFFNGTRIHVFPHIRSKNSVFQKQDMKEWLEITKDKKVTSFFIPVTPQEKQVLLTFYNTNIQSPSYDYAFFGQRCASSCYNNLKKINKIKRGSYVFNAFYPGQLRKRLEKQSRNLNYRTTVKLGIGRRKWEGG